MSLVSWQASILDASGNVVDAVSVAITYAETGLAATLYSDMDATPLSNPLITGADGFARFYALPNRYNIVATKAALSRTWLDVELVDNENNILVYDSPPSVAGQLDDVALSRTTDVYRFTSDIAGNTVTGFDATDNAGRVFSFVNLGPGVVTLTHADTGSAAGNRLALPANDSFVLLPNSPARFWQDPVTLAWRLI